MGIKKLAALAVGLALTSGAALADVKYDEKSPNENLIGSGITIGVGAVSGSSGTGYNLDLEGRLNRYFQLGINVVSVRSGDSYEAEIFEFKLPAETAATHYLSPQYVTPRFNDMSLTAKVGYPFDVDNTTFRPFIGLGFSQLRIPDIELEIVPDGEKAGGSCGKSSSDSNNGDSSSSGSSTGSDNQCLTLSFDTLNTMKIDTGIEIAWDGAHMLTIGAVSYMADEMWEDLEIGDDSTSGYVRYEYRPGNLGFTIGFDSKDQMGEPRAEMGVRLNF